MSDWYFERFEGRRPPEPVPHSPSRELVFQVLAVCAVVLGAVYLYWRWTASLNPSALTYSLVLVVAETLAFLGTVVFFLSIWRTQDIPIQPPPTRVSDIVDTPRADERPVIVDIFFATYNEDTELVRLSIKDAKAMRRPPGVDVRIHVLDDGRRAAMRQVAHDEGINYLTRQNNIGYKAGNLRNGLEQTQGDLLVIFDADTRPFPAFLERTLGYFRDPRVAWVQTPQWFYDLDEGTPLPDWLKTRLHLGEAGRLLGRGLERLFGPVRVGADPLGNDPQLFYDVIQRRRNWCNAAFCCGAGSVHRREAVMEAAVKSYAEQVERGVLRYSDEVTDPELRKELESTMFGEAARATELTPYKFHVSEDIYTSIVLHSDPDRRWKSVYHPEVLSKMLSPQDLLAWTIQRFKYAGGTLDIFRHDNPLRRPGLSGWQRLMYGSTIYSYFAPLWTTVFLLAPIIYFFTGASPVAAYDSVFYSHFLPFLVVNRLAFMFGTWGVSSVRGSQYYLAFFWLNLQAAKEVLLNRPIRFHVTPKTRESRRFWGLVWPHLALVAATVSGMCWMGTRLTLSSGTVALAFWANAFWSAHNCFSLSPMIVAALKRQT